MALSKSVYSKIASRFFIEYVIVCKIDFGPSINCFPINLIQVPMYTNPHRYTRTHPTKMRRYCERCLCCQTWEIWLWGVRSGRAKRPVCDINIDFSEPLGGLRYWQPLQHSVRLLAVSNNVKWWGCVWACARALVCACVCCILICYKLISIDHIML